MNQSIESFKDQYAFLSNFYPVEIEYQGIEFPSVEHAFQAAKSMNLAERRTFLGITPGAAKRLGRTVSSAALMSRTILSITITHTSKITCRTWLGNMNKNKRCKNCKGIYANHISYIMDAWDDTYEKRLADYKPEQIDQCNRFVLMTNLEYLAWKHEQNHAK